MQTTLTRLEQSPFNCSFHFIMFDLRPYFSMSLRTLYHAQHVELALDITEDEISETSEIEPQTLSPTFSERSQL